MLARQLQPGQLSRVHGILELAGFKVTLHNSEIVASKTPDGLSEVILDKYYHAEAAARPPDWLVDLVNHELNVPSAKSDQLPHRN